MAKLIHIKATKVKIREGILCISCSLTKLDKMENTWQTKKIINNQGIGCPGEYFTHQFPGP